MHLSKEDIFNTERIKRLNLINSITGVKPANLIGTVSNKKEPNLAIFSSVVHLGSSPALIGFIMRPANNVRRHTYENITENKYFTINHIHPSFIKNAHYTSAKFNKGESEFLKCGLNEEYIKGFIAPFVKESAFKMGLKLHEEINIKSNGCIMIVGSVEHLIFDENCYNETDGTIDLEQNKNVGIGGLNSYYSLKKINQFEYARPNNFQILK
tara:strand:+ start:137 stop:772 length:636 start_codon:yes stop_codon:yes gene_type:complete